MSSLLFKGIATALITLSTASVANAQRLLQPWEYTLTSSPVENSLGIQAIGTIYDSSIPGSTGGTTTSNPNAPVVEDYVSTSPDALNALSQHVFAGGVARANDVLFFNFFDTTGAFTGGYGVRLSQAGNFLWTVNINDPQSVKISNAGFSALYPDSGINNVGGTPSTVTFRFTGTAPTVGTTTGTIYRQKFTTVTAVPEPGSIALVIGLGISGLALRRKVRK